MLPEREWQHLSCPKTKFSGKDSIGPAWVRDPPPARSAYYMWSYSPHLEASTEWMGKKGGNLYERGAEEATSTAMGRGKKRLEGNTEAKSWSTLRVRLVSLPSDQLIDGWQALAEPYLLGDWRITKKARGLLNHFIWRICCSSVTKSSREMGGDFGNAGRTKAALWPAPWPSPALPAT